MPERVESEGDALKRTAELTGLSIDNLEVSNTRSSKTVAIYIETRNGFIVTKEDWLYPPIGKWLYKHDELPSTLLGVDDVVIKYIDKKI
ncbi:hypothetical protein VTG60DRAFT_4067 [Thermothelomyces hinnuleus]